MPYIPRTAVLDDGEAIALLYQAFARELAQVNPTMQVKPDFNFHSYIVRQLESPNTFGFVLEHSEDRALVTSCSEGSGTAEVVGFLLAYGYDEAPPPELSQEFIERHESANPFVSRRVGKVLGLYVKEEHRRPEAITGLIEAALDRGSELKLTDIDVLVSAEQTGVHRLLERHGFAKSAVQYTKHYEVDDKDSLPKLHLTVSEEGDEELPGLGVIPLRDRSGELVCNSNGEQVFLSPIRNEAGEVLRSSRGAPIYPIPLQDPQTRDFVFDARGELVVRPLLREATGEVVEYKGVPQFCPPMRTYAAGKLSLGQDREGNYVFSEPKLDGEGKVARGRDGKPLFVIKK